MFQKKERSSVRDYTARDRRFISRLSPRAWPSLRQLKYLPRILSQKELRRAQIVVILFFVSGLFLLVRGYSVITQPLPASGGTYVEGVVGAPRFINPLFLQSNDVDRDLVRLVMSGLMRYDKERKLVPDLAERYEMSGDGKTYTFFLRDGVRWHDGKPFSASDVAFTFSKIQDPLTRSPLLVSFKDIKVERVDEKTVRFILPKPFAGFLDLVTTPIIPEHAWSEIPADNLSLAALNLKPIGTGAWKFDSFKKEKDGSIRSYTVVRNDAWYGEKPFIEKITFKFYPDNSSAIQALKTRNVAGVSFLPSDLREKLSKRTDLSYYTFTLPQYTALFFNQSNNAVLSSSAVRFALAHALDRERVVRDALQNEGRPLYAPLLPGFIGYYSGVLKKEYDVAKAESLLAGAGWKRSSDGLLTKASSTLAVTLTVVENPEQKKVAEIVKDAWGKLGARVEVQSIDSSRVKQDIIDPRNYEVFLYGSLIGSDPDLYPFWHSSQTRAPGVNLSLFSHKEADKLLEEGRETNNQERRAELYRKFQDILAQEVPAIFLYSPTYNYVVSTKVKGIEDRAQLVTPADRFIGVSSWYLVSKRVLKR